MITALKLLWKLSGVNYSFPSTTTRSPDSHVSLSLSLLLSGGVVAGWDVA